jgi:hypothetical protein
MVSKVIGPLSQVHCHEGGWLTWRSAIPPPAALSFCSCSTSAFIWTRHAGRLHQILARLLRLTLCKHTTPAT